MSSTIADLALRNRLPIILATLSLVVVAALGLTRLSFSNDYRLYFSEDNPQLAAWESLQRIYTKSDSVLITLSARQGTVFTPAGLEALDELTEAAWRLPYATRVDSVTNFQRATASPDGLQVGPLVPARGALSKREVARIKEVSLSEVELVNRLASADGSTVAVNVTTTLPENPVREVGEVAAAAYRLASEMRDKHPELEVHLTGSVLFNHALAEASKADVRTLVPLMYGAILVLLWLFLGSWAAVGISLVVVTFASLLSLGLGGWAGLVLSAATVSAPTIILTLGVANCVHIFSAIFEAFRSGNPWPAAIREAVRVNVLPVFIANITTAIGFGTMITSDVPPYRELGCLVAAGTIFTYLLSVLFVPALASYLRIARPPRARLTGASLAWLGDLVIRRRSLVLVVAAVVTGGSLYGLMRLTLNDSFVTWLDHRYEFRNDTDFIDRHLSGVFRLDYSVGSGVAGGITSTAYLATLDRFAAWYRTQPGVVHVFSFSDVLKRINRTMHDDDPRFYAVPDRQDLASQYLLLYELSLPYGLDLNSYVNVSRSATRLVVTTRNLSSRELFALESAARSWLREHAPEEMRAEAASTSVLFAKIAERNVRSMLGSTLAGLVLVSALLVLPLRSLKLGLASLVPNLIPAAIGFGIWGLLFHQVGLAIAIVVGMTFGIVVDDTVHFLHRYLDARRRLRYTPEGAVHFAFQSVGSAMVATTVILCSGFLVLTASGFAINHQMALLTAVVLVVGLLADLFVLPALLLLLDRSADDGSARRVPAGAIESIETGAQ